ncbi:MAG: lyase family protein, partial [Peptococcaceae bacterium]|nr:lyase family protein [Peptococcaceae bacterium]
DDAYSTGSSMMPQKKNPDVAELIRGKTGRVCGDLQGLLTMLKGLPLAYNKDMQEDKEALFDAVDTVKKCLLVFAPMVRTMKINKKNMATAAQAGFTVATDLADYLVRKGLPFREAHGVVGQLVFYCLEHDTVLEKLSLNEYQNFCPAISEDVYQAITIQSCLSARKHPGGPASEAVNEAIKQMREKL